MKLATCPQQQRLGEYAAGGLDALTHEAVEAHLDECSECQSTLAEMDRLSGPPLARLLGKPALSETPPDDPTVLLMVARARSLAAGPECGPGTVLDEYELIEPLGAGGMGRVFRARHRRMKREVALKVLAPELLRSPAARQRFQREVESAGRLSHPHIVTAHDAREDHGRLLLVMELVEGRDLAAVVRDGGPLPVDRALDCIVQAGRGLAHAHASGLVHRDVKPANLILDAAGTVKVLDLGLAAALEPKDGPKELTAAGVPLGTAAYMAPEQAIEPAGVGPAADVYALG